LKTGNSDIDPLPYWLPPENIGEEVNWVCSAKGDIWTLGITAIELAKGEPPYYHQLPSQALHSIKKNRPPSLSSKYSKHLRKFVALCLRKNPNQRPPIDDLLNHKFITKTGKGITSLEVKKFFKPFLKAYYKQIQEKTDFEPPESLGEKIDEEQAPKSLGLFSSSEDADKSPQPTLKSSKKKSKAEKSEESPGNVPSLEKDVSTQQGGSANSTPPKRRKKFLHTSHSDIEQEKTPNLPVPFPEKKSRKRRESTSPLSRDTSPTSLSPKTAKKKKKEPKGPKQFHCW